jgi:hypothetical protein
VTARHARPRPWARWAAIAALAALVAVTLALGALCVAGG